LVNGGLRALRGIVHVDAKAGNVLAETLPRWLQRKVIAGRPVFTPIKRTAASLSARIAVQQLNSRMKLTPSSRVRALFCHGLSLASLAFAVLGGTPLALAQDKAAAGSITGQVSNLATSSTLRGAHIRVIGTTREALSDEQGNYEIVGLAPGKYTLELEYPGLDRQQIEVSVSAGQTARRDVALTTKIYTLEKFTVAGEREGNAAAIVQEKNAIAPMNVVASDAFGNIAKGNVGNFLRRIPGITGTTDEADTDNIQLRGMDAAFTSLDIDGVKYATANGGRNQSVQGIPTEMIERIEVVKSPTPDTDSDSLGGRINMVTKSAFDRKGRLLTLRAGNTYSFTYGKDVSGDRTSKVVPNWMSPSIALNYGDVFSVRGGQNNLGIMFTGNWERVFDVRGTTSWDSFSTVAGQSLPQFNNVSVALHGIERGGALLRADYKVSRVFSFGVQGSYNDSTNSLLRARNQLQNGTIRASSQGLTAPVVDGAEYAIERSVRDQQENRLSTRLWAKYDDRATGWKLAYETTLQRTRGNNFTDLIAARSNQRINYVLDRRIDTGADLRWPTIHVYTPRYTGSSTNTAAFPATFVEGYNPFADDMSNVGSTSGQWQQIYAKRQTINSKLDATKMFTTRWPIELKTGVAFKYEGFDQSRNDLRGGLNLATTGFGPDFRSLIDPDWHLGGAIGRYPVGTMLDMTKMRQAAGIRFLGNNADPALEWAYDPTKFTLNTSSTRQNTLQNNRRIWERTTGAYVQGTIHIHRLDVTTGVRGERTEVNRNQMVRDRSPGVTGTLAEWTSRQYRQTSYDKLYPSIHARMTLTANLQLRASWGMTSGKPDYGSILGVSDINEDAHQISIPNLDLRPRQSKNTDVSLAYYFEPVGELTVGVFQKQISDYDSDVVQFITPEAAADLGATPLPGDTTPWRYTTTQNTGSGRIWGLELGYTQQFSNVFPNALRGLGCFANFTVLSVDGTFDVNAVGSVPVKVSQLQNVIRRTGNAGISYNYSRYDARLTYNFTDYFPESSSTNLSTVKMRGSRWTVDASLRYKMTRKVTLMLDLVNLTSNQGAKYRGYIVPELRNETNALGFIGTGAVLVSF
jgi:iron complex outermembrane recepter protein